jgi:hypothetical protein
MTGKELRTFFKRFKYMKNKFSVQFKANGMARITASAFLIDVTTGKRKLFTDQRTLAYKDFSEFELLNYMRNWILNVSMHEVDEKILFDGKRIFDPHKVWNHLW